MRVALLISFPFRLDAAGNVATVEYGSDAEVDQQIAVALLTAPGERDQAPTFGVADPAYNGFGLGALQRHLLDFGPRVQVTAYDVQTGEDGRERVVVAWQREGSTS